MMEKISVATTKNHEQAYRNSEASSHSVEVIWMCSHRHNFWDDRLIRPFNAEDLGELL